MLSVIFAECHLCWVSFMLSVIYAGCHLCWVSFMLSFLYAECHLCWVSFMLSVIYAECHLCWVSFVLNVIYAKYHLCWVSQIRPLCWVSQIRPLCWVSFTNKAFILSVVMQNDVMLSVVAPFIEPPCPKLLKFDWQASFKTLIGPVILSFFQIDASINSNKMYYKICRLNLWLLPFLWNGGWIRTLKLKIIRQLFYQLRWPLQIQMKFLPIWAQCHKTFYVYNLPTFVIS